MSLFLAAAVLAYTPAPAAESVQPAAAPVIVEPTLIMEGCAMPDYPASALQNEQTGIVFMGLFVSATGDVEQATVLNSSGVNALDQGALTPLSKCRYTPGTINGKPVAMWLGRHYFWELEGSDLELIRRLAASARAGNMAALYSVYYLWTVSSVADSSSAQRSLMLAADKGNGSAQFQLGQQFSGKVSGFKADLPKAQYWYDRAAANGHVLATQALAYMPASGQQ
jgi:TonB family protein